MSPLLIIQSYLNICRRKLVTFQKLNFLEYIKNGLIKIRHVGPLTADIWEEKFSALLKK